MEKLLNRSDPKRLRFPPLFQMSPTDSGGLLDSPAASKLGRNRTLFASEKQNWLEKFRPYGVPSEQWIKEVGDGLRRRTLA